MDEVTVEDADAGEVIETIMVDESVDVPISVSGEDSSVPVTIVDESIPVDTVVEADGKYFGYFFHFGKGQMISE